MGAPGYLLHPPSPPFPLLGIHANAHQGPACLLGVGLLLPHWRTVARLLAPVLFPPQGPVQAALLLSGQPGVGMLCMRRLRAAAAHMGCTSVATMRVCTGRHTATAAACAALGVHMVPLDAHDLLSTSDTKTCAALAAAFEGAAELAPCVLALGNLDSLCSVGHDASASQLATRLAGALATCVAAACAGPAPVALVAVVASPDDLPVALRRVFTHEVAIMPPDQQARTALLEAHVGQTCRQLAGHGSSGDTARDPCDQRSVQDATVQDVAMQTAGATPRDLMALVTDATARRLHATSPTLSPQHLAEAVAHLAQRTAEGIGAPKVPNIRWGDVGGLHDVKKAILDTVELPLKHPQLFAKGLRRRSGMLLYGPPGTGKTLLAKAVATECGTNFLSVKGPELINMYIGESERQVRGFVRVCLCTVCVLFGGLWFCCWCVVDSVEKS